MSESFEEQLQQVLRKLGSKMDPRLLQRIKKWEEQGPVEVERSREELCRHYHEIRSEHTSDRSTYYASDLSASSCAVCALVYQGLKTALKSTPSPKDSVDFKLKPNGSFVIKYKKHEDDGLPAKFEVFVDRDPLGEGSTERILELFDTCLEGHSHCKLRTSDKLKFPLRLINIDESNGAPRLVMTKDGEDLSYVALSHCWGAEQTYQTTLVTLSDRLRALDWDIMPKTYQDAIKVARVIGIDHIWMDSICIVQDGPPEWNFESARMADIYRNAIVTIAASASAADVDGFLHDRNRYLSTVFSVDHEAFSGERAVFRIREKVGRHLRHDVWSLIRDSWRSNLIRPSGLMEPLDYRAWVFQERLVSRRLLSFGSREIEWDCCCCCDCECGERYNEYWTNEGSINLRNSSARETNQLLTIALEDTLSYTPHTTDSRSKTQDMVRSLRLKVFQMWRMVIVPAYTQLKLTRESDRLPALSAVASELSKLLETSYLCGMWTSDLPASLNWTVGEYGANNPKACSVNDLYRAPSWSWSSVVGPVDFLCDYEDDFEPICELIDASIMAATSNRFSDAQSGFAHIRGIVISGKIELQVTRDRNNQSQHTEHVNSQCNSGSTTLSCHVCLGDKKLPFRPDT